MKIKNKLTTLIMAIGMTAGFAGTTVAASDSNCCLKLCGKYPHPKIVQACLSDCYDMSNGECNVR